MRRQSQGLLDINTKDAASALIPQEILWVLGALPGPGHTDQYISDFYCFPSGHKPHVVFVHLNLPGVIEN